MSSDVIPEIGKNVETAGKKNEKEVGRVGVKA